ncbi:MAG: component of SufBCD complex [Pseudomonadota bacterium]
MPPDYLLYLVELDSFWSLWYWVMVAVSWSVVSHWTLGVPFDLVINADRRGGVWAEHCDTLTHINVFRLTSVFREFGVALMALAGFIVGAIGTIGFWANVEFARALFVLILPHGIAALFSVRAAFWIERESIRGKPLRRAIRRQRFWTQFVGFWGILLCASFAIYEAMVFYGEV